MKVCTKCSQEKELSLFSKDKSRKDGYYPVCKECNKDLYLLKREERLAQKREYGSRPEVKQREKEYKKLWYSERKDLVKEQIKLYYREPENRVKKLLSKSKERALESGLDWDLQVEDIIIPEYCPYLDVKLTHELGQGQLGTNSSLDRIDSTKGYIKGNVQVISRLANTMKSSATEEQLITFAINVLKIKAGMEGTTVQQYIEAICNDI